MKYFKYILCFIASTMMLSCTTTQKFTVTGKPGTTIYSPNRTELATIDASGVANIELDGSAYYAFLLSKEKGDDIFTPFALDYKKKIYGGSKFGEVTGGILMGVGLAGTLVTACIGGGLIVLPFVGSFGAGIAFLPSMSRQQQLDHRFKFEYLSEQTTNQDFAFTRPDIKVVDFVASEVDKAETKNKQAEVVEKEKASSKSTKSFGSKSTKSFKDYGTVLAGEYVGNGTLSINGNVIEKYANIIVELHRIDNKKVAVQVVEANGVEFFGEASSYSVRKNSDGTFSLVHNDVSVATIKTDGNSKLVYLHPRVNIDGDMYTLKITANKK